MPNLRQTPPTREPSDITEINRRADHFEALFRARFTRAMDEVAVSVTQDDLVVVFGPGGRRQENPLLVMKIQDILKRHLGDVITRSFMQGGLMGQRNVHKLGR